MSRYEGGQLPEGTRVCFRNLLECENEDICVGTVCQDGTIDCKCGCAGCFEPEDIEILEILPEGEKHEELYT